MKILVVDDSGFARKRISLVLKKAGAEILEAEGGEQALEIYQAEKPEMVTVDLLMPVMDGIELIRRLKGIDPGVKIIVISSDIQDQTREAAMAAGASAFLAKMERPSVMLHTIETLRSGERHVDLIRGQGDALSKLANTSMGRAARALESLLNRRVDLNIPEIRTLRLKDLSAFFEVEAFSGGTLVQQTFSGEAHGFAYLIFGRSQSEILVRSLLGGGKQIERLSSAEQTALVEVGNIVINAAVSILGDRLNARLTLSIPVLFASLTNQEVLDVILAPFNSIDHAVVLVSRLQIGEISLMCYLALAVPEKTANLLMDAPTA